MPIKKVRLPCSLSCLSGACCYFDPSSHQVRSPKDPVTLETLNIQEDRLTCPVGVSLLLSLANPLLIQWVVDTWTTQVETEIIQVSNNLDIPSQGQSSFFPASLTNCEYSERYQSQRRSCTAAWKPSTQTSLLMEGIRDLSSREQTMLLNLDLLSLPTTPVLSCSGFLSTCHHGTPKKKKKKMNIHRSLRCEDYFLIS